MSGIDWKRGEPPKQKGERWLVVVATAIGQDSGLSRERRRTMRRSLQQGWRRFRRIPAERYEPKPAADEPRDHPLGWDRSSTERQTEKTAGRAAGL